MSWRWIDSSAALQQVLDDHADCAVVAMDTEFMRRDTFYPQVALVQLCFDSQAFLVDPLALADTASLKTLLSRPDVVKVFHSVSEDLEVFDRWLGVLPEPLFDTQRAAALLGEDFGIGYSGLVERLCGESLAKGETRSDWLQRPLTASQCDYAAQDVTWLMAVWRVLDARAREQGRLEWVLQEGRDTLASFRDSQAHPVQRIKSAWKLNRRQLALLMRICEWREAEARRRDKPRGWIVDDAACLAIAQAQPPNAETLGRVEALNPAARRRYGEVFQGLVEEVAGLQEAALPQRLPAPLNAEERKRLKRLKQRGQALAEGLGVAPALALAGRDYELLLRESGGTSVAPPPSWGGWRETQLIGPLRQLLKEGQL
ncbi:ribonuclease D [Haliea atlantica]|nr:ribonuclease D [Haliea sp.]|tara:strand:+ start:1371 stop:2486 length:1116 start_codon:yes stop_codon:yes gene_type:complete